MIFIVAMFGYAKGIQRDPEIPFVKHGLLHNLELFWMILPLTPPCSILRNLPA